MMSTRKSCRLCDSESIVIDTKSADEVCSECGCVWGKWSPEYGENMDYDKSYYVRKTYFKTILSTMLGWTGLAINLELVGEIRSHMSPEDRIDARADSVRAVLRTMRLTKYYKSVPPIVHVLRTWGMKPRPAFPSLEHHEIEALENMFHLAASSFDELRWKARKNMISYNFAMAELLKDIGRYDDFEPYIMTIRTKSKLKFAVRAWTAIHPHLPWSSESMETRKRTRKGSVRIRDYSPTYFELVKSKRHKERGHHKY